MSYNEALIQTNALPVIHNIVWRKTLMWHPHGGIALALAGMLLHDLRWTHVVTCWDKLLVSLDGLDTPALDRVIVRHSDGVRWWRHFASLRRVLIFSPAVASADILIAIYGLLLTLDVKAVQEVVEHLLGDLLVVTCLYLLCSSTELWHGLLFLFSLEYRLNFNF